MEMESLPVARVPVRTRQTSLIAMLIETLFLHSVVNFRANNTMYNVSAREQYQSPLKQMLELTDDLLCALYTYRAHSAPRIRPSVALYARNSANVLEGSRCDDQPNQQHGQVQPFLLSYRTWPSRRRNGQAQCCTCSTTLGVRHSHFHNPA